MASSDSHSLPTIAFQGINTDGQLESGYVQADSNQSAIKQLEDRGITHVRLYGDTEYADGRTQLHNLSKQERARLAAFEVESLTAPSMWLFLREVLFAQRAPIIAGMLVFAGSAYLDSSAGMFSGALIGLTLPALSVWAYRASLHYNKGVRAWSLGDWDKAATHFNWLLARYDADKMPDMVIDLTSRLVVMPNLYSTRDDALALLEARRALFESHVPGAYHQARAAVMMAAGDSDAALLEFRELRDLAQRSVSTRLDLAIVEARFGDLCTAKMLLETLNKEVLSEPCKPGLDWLEGEITLREGNELAALSHLNHAVGGFLIYRKNPVIWGVLAICTGSLALVMSRLGETDKAEVLLRNVRPVLLAHADRVQLAKLKLKFPGLLADTP